MSGLRAPGIGDGFEYGNARVRALKGALLDEAGYDRLLGRGLDGLLAALGEGAYRPDVEAALPRARGLGALHRALSANLARTLEAVRGFYGGRAGRAVSLLLSRWEVEALVAILRGQARRLPVEETLATVVPAGALDAVAVGEAARRPGLRPAAELLFGWGAPSRDLARAAVDAAADYERTEDLASLEQAVFGAWSRQVDRALDSLPAGDEALEEVLRGDIDRRNLVAALRLREAGGSGAAAEEDRFLDGGRLERRTLDEVARADARETVASALAAAPGAGLWTEAVARWVEDGDLPGVDRALGASLTMRTVSLFRRGDPLGVAVPAAFAAAKENEVRNLRLLGFGTAAGLPPGVLRAQLVMPW